MRVAYAVTIAAVSALAASIAGTDTSQAQGLLMAAPADSAAPISQPTFDDKVQTGTALPPKTGTLVFLKGVRQKVWLGVTGGGRSPARRSEIR
jgi:hypothetical protein